MWGWLREHGPAIRGLSLTQFSAYTYLCITLLVPQAGALTFLIFLPSPL